MIAHHVTLTTPDPAKRLYLFTDASYTHCADLISQVDLAEMAQYAVLSLEWDHSPLASISGSCREPFSCRTTPEQERYANVASFTRLSLIFVAYGEFSLFTDHKNIMYMLAPTRFNANVARHIVHNTQRWALRLLEFNFTVTVLQEYVYRWKILLEH